MAKKVLRIKRTIEAGRDRPTFESSGPLSSRRGTGADPDIPDSIIIGALLALLMIVLGAIAVAVIVA